MKTLTAALLAATMLTAPAMAWTARTGGSGPQAIGQDGGSATAQAQHQSQSQTAHSASRSSATATGGTATGGTGGSSNVSVTNTTGGSGGGSYGGSGRAPDVFVPSISSSSADCPTVGFGAGGSGLGGGGGFGPSWISSDCNKRKVADLLSNVFGPEVARAYAIEQIEGVKEAVAASKPVQPVEYQHPAWCRTNTGIWLRDLPECGEKP